MRINRKIAGFILIGIAALLVLIVAALPPLLKYFMVKKIDEATGRKSQIASISLNPFTLTAALKGVKISERGGGSPFLAFSSARLSLSPLSLPKRSFIVTELKVKSPYLHIVRDAPNRYNFSDLLTPQKGEKKQKEGTPLFSLNNIILEHGRIDFQDKALAAERYHHISDLAVSIPFVSNMPYLADRYVQPHLAAVVNGSPFRFDGRLQPLTRAVEATLHLNVKQVDLPFYLGYLPTPLPVKVNSGTLATSLEIGYRVDAKTGPEMRVAGNVAVDRTAISEPDGSPLAALDHGRLEINNAWLVAKRVDIRSLELKGVEIHASRDRSGVWNFQKLKKLSTGKPEKLPPRQAETRPVDLKLAKFQVLGGKIHLVDNLPPRGFRTDLSEVEIGAQAFSLARGAKSPVNLGFRTGRGERVSLKGEFGAAPASFTGSAELTGVPLQDYYPYLSGALTAPLSGTAAFSSKVSYSEAEGVVLTNGELTGKGIAWPFGQGEGIRLKELKATGIGYDLKRNKAGVERIALTDGNIVFSSDKSGTMSFQRLFRTTKPAAQPRAATRHKPEASPLSYRVQKITGKGFGIRFTDGTNRKRPAFTLRGLKFTVAGISAPEQRAIPLTLATTYGRSGSIAATGTLSPKPLGFKGRISLRGIPLRDFDPYIPEDTTVFIAGGALDTTLSLDLAKHPSGLTGKFAGQAGVRSFYCQDMVRNEDLLKWERLQVDDMSGTISPFTLAISDVSLTNFYSRVVVRRDGTLNLQHLRQEEKPSAAKRPADGKVAQPSKVAGQRKSAPAPGGETAAQPHPIRIDAITVQGGTLSFSDRHMQSPFDTTFYNLGGRVSGLSSQATKLADVDLRGNLENHSPLSIKGVINPLRGDLYLDLRISFKDIELSPFTPYSNTYLGYNVDKGKLFLDLDYKIDKKTLTSQNKVFVDQFSFGKQVDSPKATKLPVRLAIALLKDRKGEIHLDLPVEGRTDDPKFSVWKVVLQILKNLVVKAATSPMALLGSMFGGGEDFSAVSFPAGSAQLGKPEQDKLSKLSKVLHDRPAMNVEMTGYVDRERDAEGYRNELLQKKMKGEKFRKLVKEGKRPEEIAPQELEITPQEYPEYLKDVYRKEKFPKPRNVLGFAKDLPESEMKKLIITHTVVGDNQLQSLARERAEAVKAFLMKEGIPPERLYEKSGDIYKPPAKEMSSARVEFGASVK